MKAVVPFTFFIVFPTSCEVVRGSAPYLQTTGLARWAKATAATGILVYASASVSATSNTVGNSQLGISFDSDPTDGSADGGTIAS